MERLRFVAVVIPTLTALGVLLQVAGWSQQAALAVTMPILVVATVWWSFSSDMRDRRNAGGTGQKTGSQHRA